jgi:hypothetical protein
MVKVRLFVHTRKTGSRIESVPVRQLVKLSNYKKTHWTYEEVKVNSEGESVAGGWLILEAF